MTENSKASLNALEFYVFDSMGNLWLCWIFWIQAFSVDPFSGYVAWVNVTLCGCCKLYREFNTPDVVVCYMRDVDFFRKRSTMNIVPRIDSSQVVVGVRVSRSWRKKSSFTENFEFWSKFFLSFFFPFFFLSFLYVFNKKVQNWSCFIIIFKYINV